ncbi:GNAT family N-acetyltransferase, partial [Micromonospora phytophila]|uniref:GNAT family N-acetyltransferase n=1 Tax=Micromonospora phytophila TaxID=709888 RepID=UPI00202F0814
VHDDVFRWCADPAPLPDVGEWIPPAAPGLPSWLRLFDRPVLVVRDERGRYLAGVGVKRHDAYGHELAVGTAPAARGRGLARRLVAQAARRVLADGAVPTYLHDRANTASARVAEAAGFPDRGWRSYGVYPA